MASLSLQNAYNLYLQNYAHTLPGVPENQKKADSKDTARLLAKVNSNSPTYVNSSALASKDSALQLKKISLDLEKNMEPFQKSASADVFAEQTAYCLDDSIADIRYAPEYSTHPSNSFSLEVQQLAKEQINTGKKLPDSTRGLRTGTHSFNLSFDHMNYEFQFEVRDSDTNLSIGEKVASMIRNAHIGIDASINTAQNGTSFLELKTLQTGIDPDKDLIFSVSDKSAPGGPGFVSYFGIDYVSQFPDNSSFSIDGNQLSTHSNKVTLTNGFLLSLKNTTTQPVDVLLKTDEDTISERLHKFVDSFNQSLQELIDFDPPSSSLNVLADKLSNAPSAYAESLKEMGISIDSSKKLILDEDTLRNKIKESENISSVSDILAPVHQLCSQISEIVKKAIIDPITFTNSAIASYKNVAKNNYANPYVSSAYSGMYFNAYR